MNNNNKIYAHSARYCSSSYCFFLSELLLASTAFFTFASSSFLGYALYLMETFTLIFYMVLTEEDKTIHVIRNYRIFSYAISTYFIVYTV